MKYLRFIFKNIKKVWPILALIIIVVLAYMYWNSRREIAMVNDPALRAKVEKQQVSDLLSKVEKLVMLPKDETPVVATITDVDTLTKQQAFYTGALNGDKLIIYAKSQKAILYSPSRNIIVNIGPIIQNQENNTTAQPAQTPKAPTSASTTKAR